MCVCVPVHPCAQERLCGCTFVGAYIRGRLLKCSWACMLARACMPSGMYVCKSVHALRHVCLQERACPQACMLARACMPSGMYVCKRVHALRHNNASQLSPHNLKFVCLSSEAQQCFPAEPSQSKRDPPTTAAGMRPCPIPQATFDACIP